MIHRRLAWAFLLIGFLFAAAWSAGAGAAPAPAPAPASPAPSSPAMWKLETDKATVYFLGSFHLLPPDIVWRNDPRIDKALQSADQVLFEVDMAGLDTPEGQAAIVRHGVLPGDRTLHDVLHKETYDALAFAAGRFGMPLARLERLQPWMAAAGLMVGYMTSRGADPESGVDDRLTRDARAAGKPVAGLETIDEQFTALDLLSAQDPDLIITDMLRLLDEKNGVLSQVLAAWREGDEQAIDRLLREDLEKVDGAYDRFITNRNAAWVPKIDALIKQGGTYFVVVGAGHLVGDQSVIAMLRAKGYAIERY